MKWIKSLSAKVVGNRLDGSPDAKMRRSLKRKASLSSPTASSSDNSWEGADAKWRVENILVNGPPSEAEWWGEESLNEEKIVARLSASKTNNNKKKGAACAAAACFHNCGHTAWELARAEWRIQSVPERPPRPPPVRYEQVSRVLREGPRNFELPGRMRLKDLVNVYTDVWECDSDPW